VQVDAAPRDASDHLPFTRPTDFGTGAACTGVGLETLDLAGVWAVDLAFSGRKSVSVLHFQRQGTTLVGDNTAIPLDHLEQTSDRLFFYRAAEREGIPNVRSYLACGSTTTPGSFVGLFGYCDHGTCAEGTFRAHRVERVPGEAEADGITKLGEFGAFGVDAINVNVRVSGNHAYLARYEDGMRILDVSDPATPRPIGHGPVETTDTREIYNDVKLVPGYAFMSSNAHGVVIWDVANPAAPLRVSNMLDGANVHTIFLVGTTLYLAASQGGFSGLVMFDVGNPLAPRMLGTLEQPANTNYLHDLFIEAEGGVGTRAYLNYWDAGLLVVDVSDPTRPRELGRYADYMRRTSHSSWVTTIGGRKICVTGDEDFDAHARVLDVTDPANIQLLSEWQLRPAVSIHNIMAQGERFFVAHYQDGVRVLDLSDPRLPRQIAHYNTWDSATAGGASFFDGACGIDVVGDRIYVADISRGLLVLRLDR
jgi:hypothetical protein